MHLRLDSPEVQEKLAAAIDDAVRDHTKHIDEEELKAFADVATAALGAERWAALENMERRFLAAAWRCREEGRWRYAGIEIGLAVEHTLDDRLFQRLRVRASPSALTAGDGETTGIWKPFLAKGKRQPTLGVKIGALRQALAASVADGTIAPVLRELLRALGASPLFAMDGALHRRRFEGLGRIVKVRNDCSHPKDPPQADGTEAAWGAAVADGEDAFFRYFADAVPPIEGTVHDAA